MLTVTVYHHSQDGAQLVPVATVESNSTNIAQALDDAWVATNHIDHPWYENPNVTMLIEVPYQVRSSMVDDIFEVNGVRYRVMPFGFDPKPPSPDAPSLSATGRPPTTGLEPFVSPTDPDTLHHAD